VVVDTSAWIEWLTDGPLAKRIAAYMDRLDELVVPTLVQHELYKWAVRERDEAAAIELIGLTAQGQVRPLDTTLAVAAADPSAQFSLPMVDAIIYACARALEMPLATCDAHFRGLAGVEYLTKRASRTRA
jgi:predicted nucleic acid-binding protein